MSLETNIEKLKEEQDAFRKEMAEGFEMMEKHFDEFLLKLRAVNALLIERLKKWTN